MANLADLASAGQEADAIVGGLLHAPDISVCAVGYLAEVANVNVGQGGTFDYQRRRDDRGFVQYPQFRSVANFNVGLFMQQTGVFSLDETLSVAGGLAGVIKSPME